MATHSSILGWRIPWTEEPGGLVHRVAKSQTQLEQLSRQAGFYHNTTSIFSFVDGHLGCSHNLAIENNAMMNIVWYI